MACSKQGFMKKSLIVYGIITLVFSLLIWGLYFNFYEFRSVLKLPPVEENQIILSDSTIITPIFYIDPPAMFCAAIYVEHLADSLYFREVHISITSTDHPDQEINLTHVLAYKDSVNEGDLNQSYVRAYTFEDLPRHYRSMSINRDRNGLRFYFETSDVNRSTYYILDITGKAVYRGKLIGFKKRIKGIRKKELRPVQMMT